MAEANEQVDSSLIKTPVFKTIDGVAMQLCLGKCGLFKPCKGSRSKFVDHCGVLSSKCMDCERVETTEARARTFRVKRAWSPKKERVERVKEEKKKFSTDALADVLGYPTP